MPDWVINDNGIRIPTTTEPASPIANSMQLYATSTGLHTKDENGVVERLGVTSVGTRLIAHDKFDLANVSQINVDVSGVSDDDYYMLNLLLFTTPIDTGARDLRMTFNNDSSALYDYRRTGLTRVDGGAYVDLYGQTPESDVSREVSARYLWNMRFWDWGTPNKFISYANQNVAGDIDLRGVTYGVWRNYATVTSINIVEDANRIFGIGTEWFLLGYLR
jgi:hypothetical protein